jgi:ferredoxin
LFGRNDDTGTSFVKQQPQNDEELALMQEALGTCATSSIGDDGE